MRTLAAGLVAAALGGVALVAWGCRRPDEERVRFDVHEGTSMAIALSPDKQRIAFDLQGTLWVMPVTGGTATALTDAYGDSRQPTWSPDGRTIAFQSYRDGQWRIWTLDVASRRLTPVTSGPFDDREPHWSPDGQRLAFSSDRAGNYDIWVLTLATGTVAQVTTNPANDYFPTWSPDGQAIAFVSTRTPVSGVYTTTRGGREQLVTEATGNIGGPSWTADGRVLFTTMPAPLASMAAAPGAPPLPSAPRLMLGTSEIASAEDYFPFRAQWLSEDEFLYPAGGRIKHRSLSRGLLGEVPFTVTLEARPASYTRRNVDLGSTTPRRALGIVRPVVSPDGRTLAYAALGDIWTQPITGGEPTRLTDDVWVDTDPAWSPDGTQLAFVSDRAGSMDIWIRDLARGTDRQLTSGPDAEMAPAWAPDGTAIAYVSNQAYEQGELHVIPAAGGEPRRLRPRLFGVGYPQWTPDGSRILTSAVVAYSSRFRESMNYYWSLPVEGGEADLAIPERHEPVGKRAGDGPALSPDGRHVAYVRHGLLYVQPVDGRGVPTASPRALTRELIDSISWAGNDRVLGIATDRLVLVSIADGAMTDLPAGPMWQRAVPAGRVVVHAGRLVDAVNPTPRQDVDIVIERDRIVEIEAHRDDLHHGRLIDASQQTVIPGLIEGHSHTLIEHGTLFGRVHLAYGVTSVRDVGGLPYDELESREAIESGRRPGPRVFNTGYLHDGARPYYPMASTMPSEAVVDLELERARRLGYFMFKTYVRLPDRLQQRAFAGAHRIGIPTSSHEIYPAALSGADSVEHTGATSRRGYTTKQSLAGRAYEDVIQIVSKGRLTLTPTLGLGGFQIAVARDPTLIEDPRWQRLQPPWATTAARRVVPPSQLENPKRTVLALHRAGVRLIAGVDSPLAPYATALHVELHDYVAAGLTPFEALQTATRNTAELMGVGRDLGTLEVGKLADLVVVDGNPLERIADTLRVRTIVKNGEVYTVEQLLDLTASER